MQIGINKYIIQSFKIIKIHDEFNSPITYSRSSLINALGSTLFHYLITTTIGSRTAQSRSKFFYIYTTYLYVRILRDKAKVIFRSFCATCIVAYRIVRIINTIFATNTIIYKKLKFVLYRHSVIPASIINKLTNSTAQSFLLSSRATVSAPTAATSTHTLPFFLQLLFFVG